MSWCATAPQSPCNTPLGNTRRLDQKESRRWVEVTRHAADRLAAGATSVLVIADREADLYETFACLPAGVDGLVRVHHNRKLADGSWLFDACARQPELGRETVAVPAVPGRKARTATVALRAGRVEIPRPKRNHPQQAAALPASVGLTLLEVREIEAPERAHRPARRRCTGGC